MIKKNYLQASYQPEIFIKVRPNPGPNLIRITALLFLEIPEASQPTSTLTSNQELLVLKKI